jgi:hypothetical protein
MTYSAKINCTIGTSDSTVPLGLEIWLDNVCVLNLDWVQQEQMFETICHDDNDDNHNHQLKFVLKNKKTEHTTVSPEGEIISDAVLYVKNIQFEDINVDHVVQKFATYTHDFNGSGNVVHQKFFNTLGCNGTVTLDFSTPVYVWLLEYM